MSTPQPYTRLAEAAKKELAQRARAAEREARTSSEPTVGKGAMLLFCQAATPQAILGLLEELDMYKRLNKIGVDLRKGPSAISAPFDHDLARKLAQGIPPKTRADWERWFKYDDHNYPSDRRRVKVADGQGNEAFAGYDDDRGWVTDRPIGPVVEWRELASK